MLWLAAVAERFSEHLVAAAVRQAARERGLESPAPDTFTALAGLGVEAHWNDHRLLVGSRQLLREQGIPLPPEAQVMASWQAAGKTVFFVAADDRVVGLLAVADAPRPEVPEALAALRRLGMQRFLLLTGDNERTASALAERLGVEYRAELLPEDKLVLSLSKQSPWCGSCRLRGTSS